MFFFRKSNQFIFVPNLNTNLSRFNIVSSFFSFRFFSFQYCFKCHSSLFRALQTTYLPTKSIQWARSDFSKWIDKPNFIDFEMIKMSVNKLAQVQAQICLLVSRKLRIWIQKQIILNWNMNSVNEHGVISFGFWIRILRESHVTLIA